MMRSFAFCVSLLAIAAHPAAAQDMPPTVSIEATQPVTLEEFGNLFEGATGRDVTFHLSPSKDFVRTDMGRRLKFNWSGSPNTLLDSITQRFNLRWRGDWDAIRVYDDARFLPPISAKPLQPQPVERVAAEPPLAVPIPAVNLSPPAAPSPVAALAPKPIPVVEPTAAENNNQAASAWAAGEYDTAVRLWQKPASEDDANALYNLGQAARLGRGMEKDVAVARELYSRAASIGLVRAKTQLGLLLVEDPATASIGRNELKEAAAAGDQRATRALEALPKVISDVGGRRSIILGDFATQRRALKAYFRAAKIEGLSAFILRVAPFNANYRLSVDNVPSDVAVEMCSRLTSRGQYCTVS
jgi:hypothetical protein